MKFKVGDLIEYKNREASICFAIILGSGVAPYQEGKYKLYFVQATGVDKDLLYQYRKWPTSIIDKTYEKI